VRAAAARRSGGPPLPEKIVLAVHVAAVLATLSTMLAALSGLVLTALMLLTGFSLSALLLLARLLLAALLGIALLVLPARILLLIRHWDVLHWFWKPPMRLRVTRYTWRSS
jgi:hypothetical protein